MKKIEYYDIIFSKLLELIPNPDTELIYENPFQLLVSVILSAQTTDKQVNKVTENIFKKIKNPEDILKYSEVEIETAFSSVNYYKMKTKHIIQTAKKIIERYTNLSKNDIKQLTKSENFCYEQYGYYLPEDKEKLKTLPWVWEKTAKVFLYVQYHHPLIAVDTHVHRVSNRLWIVNTREPLETSERIEKIIPEKWKFIAHHILILFGRYYCTAKKPKCENCVIQNFCKFYKS